MSERHGLKDSLTMSLGLLTQGFFFGAKGIKDQFASVLDARGEIVYGIT